MLKDNFRSVRDFFRLVRVSKLWVTIHFLGSIIGHLGTLLAPVFAANIIYYLTEGDTAATMYNVIYLGIAFLVTNIGWIMNFVGYSYNYKFTYKNLIERITNKILSFDTDFSTKISKSKIINTVSIDATRLAEMVDSICEIIIVAIKLIVVIIIFMMTNIYIGLFVLILEIFYVYAFDYCNSRSSKHLRSHKKYNDMIVDKISQMLNGLGEIKVFNLFTSMKKNMNVVTNKWSDEFMKERKYIDRGYSVLPIIADVGRILLYVILIFLVADDFFEINVLVMLIAYYENVFVNTNALMNYSRIVREWDVSINRIKDVLNYKGDKEVLFGEVDIHNVSGVLKFKNVSFKYKGRSTGALKNVSLVINPNEITTFVGHSGSGKTTMTNLLLRKYKLSTGSITLDGDDIYGFTKNSYSNNVVGVNQKPFIFNMSIKKNLSMIDSNVNNQITACKSVGIHNYIMKLPNGYNTILKEDNNALSNSQRQLLSIVRALLSKSEVLIFDEVTSSLDSMLEYKVIKLFEDLKQDHTIILVTHDKKIMELSDNLIVLNEGKIVGKGKHKDLVKSNKEYIKLRNSNTSSLISKEKIVELNDK